MNPWSIAIIVIMCLCVLGAVKWFAAKKLPTPPEFEDTEDSDGHVSPQDSGGGTTPQHPK